MHDGGEHSISDLAEIFSVSRPTAHRTMNKRKKSLECHSALNRNRPLRGEAERP